MSFDQQNQQRAQPQPRRRWWLIAVPAIAVVAGLVWLAVALLMPDRFTVNGELTAKSRCGGDIAIGGQVAILNRASEPLAVGRLAQGPGGTCKRTFTVSDVPAGEDLYGVRVGSDDRGVVWKSETELRNGVSLTIG